MSDTIKEQERNELHKTIWAMSNKLRGSVSGWDFKQYVLCTIFYRFISESFTDYVNKGEIEAGAADFDYAKLTDEEAESAREDLVKSLGYFILPSQLFCNVCDNARNDENLNMTIEKVFRSIEGSAVGTESEASIAGLFDDFKVNDTRLGKTVEKRNQKLVQILEGIRSMNLSGDKQHVIDVFGDAYEYLMNMYAANAGKVGGEYFTPQEVARLLALLATSGRKTIDKVYDPACGSGSLLLQVARVIGPENIRVGIFGQEIEPTTYNLCRINMFLHDVGYDKFSIANEDTLLEPQHWDDEPFDVIVSNPPYSIPWKGEDNPLLINDPRFSPAGVLAPKNNSDFGFIMHALSWLSTDGTGAFVCFPGIMYRSGAEQKIRRYLVTNNFVDSIIQLPGNMFFGVGISTTIMVLKKNKQDNSILFVDASKQFVKNGNKNKLAEENIQTIVEACAARQDVQYFTRLVPFAEVEGKDFNLSVSTYVEQEDTREEIDIQKLNTEIADITLRGQELRAQIDAIIEDLEA